jgi:PAS domain S-box-containing protein
MQEHNGIDDLARENAALRARVAALEAESAALRARPQPDAAASAPLSEVGHLLAAVLDQLPVGVSIAEAPSGRLLMHNAEAVRLIGHPLLEGADYTSYAQYGALHPDGRPYTPDEYPIARALLTGRPIPFEDMDYRRGDGTLTIFAVNAAPIFGEGGRLIAVVSTFHEVAHQRRLEAALRESEARFSAAFRTSPVAMVLSTLAEGRILDTNERYLALFGRTREDTIGLPSTTIGIWANPADRLRGRELLARDGRIRDWEVVLQGARDEPRHVLASVEPLQIAGTPCILTALYDITDRVRAEVALRKSTEHLQEREVRLQAIIENAGAAVWSIDADYRLTMANTAFLQAEQARSGREVELGMEMPLEWAPEPTRSDMRALYARALGGETVQEERVTWMPTGELLAWEITINPIVDAKGRMLGATCIARDTSARKAYELALQRSESLYRTIVRTLPDACVLVIGPDMRYLVAEGPLLALLGLSREQLEGHTPAEALDADLAAAVGERFRCALAGEEITIESVIVTRTLLTRYVPLRNGDDRVHAALALAIDITERKRLEAQLLQSQKMEGIGQLAGGVAHDFNNLLTAIGGYADLVISDLPPDAPQRADMAEIQRAADRATALARQLLTFARRRPIELRPLRLNDLVSNLEKLLGRLIGAHIQLVTELAPDLGPVAGDPGQIEQVLINLAVNARDAMPGGGILTITTTNVELGTRFALGHVDLPAGPYVMLAVSDTGMGIPRELQQHLFEPFFTTKPPGQGTGLGLATCYGIIKQHGGTIWLYSEVGHGTVVKIYLPLNGSDAVGQVEDEAASALPRGDETVLLAEDEPAVRSLAARVLRDCGYTVLEAADGAEAVRVAQSYAPQLIHLLLSDVVMPHIGGPEAADQVRAAHPAIRVLFMSGYTGFDTAPHAVAAHAEPIIQKPFSPTDLARAVRAALDS